MDYQTPWLPPCSNGIQNSFTYEPQNSQIVPVYGGMRSPVTGFGRTEFTAAEWQSDLGIGEAISSQPLSNLKVWELLQPLPEPIIPERIYESSRNPEIQNSDGSDDLDLVMELFRDPALHPLQNNTEEMAGRRHSSDFSLHSRCETPFGPDSAGSSPRSENFDLNNVERQPVSYHDPLRFCGSHITQSVPEMFRVPNNRIYCDISPPVYTNNNPPPPYHYPHIKDTSSNNVQKKAPPSYPTSKRNKVQRKSTPLCYPSSRNIVQEYKNPPKVAEIALLPHETPTEKLIRLFGRKPQAVSSSSSNVDTKTQLWQFLLQLLGDSRNSHIICWEGSNGEFRFVKPADVAARWGQSKGKKKMNYENLSRSLRYYYDKQMLVKSRSKKFVYQFLIKGILSALTTPRISDSEFIQPSCE